MGIPFKNMKEAHSKELIVGLYNTKICSCVFV
jgi:hypothetical protein